MIIFADMRRSRLIVYVILIGLLALMGYVGLSVNAKYLAYLSASGIVFLVINFFATGKE